MSSVLFDPTLSDMSTKIEVFNKSLVNPLLQSVSTCLKKNDILNDQSAAALKCVEPVMLLVYKHYDQRIHQPTLEHMKQILQTLFKKVENHVSQGTFSQAKMGTLATQ